MTVIHKDHKVTARASLRDWAVLIVMIGSFFSAGVIAWTKLEEKASAAQAKANQVETDLSDFKERVSGQLKEIGEGVAYIKGMIRSEHTRGGN